MPGTLLSADAALHNPIKRSLGCSTRFREKRRQAVSGHNDTLPMKIPPFKPVHAVATDAKPDNGDPALQVCRFRIHDLTTDAVESLEVRFEEDLPLLPEEAAPEDDRFDDSSSPTFVVRPGGG